MTFALPSTLWVSDCYYKFNPKITELFAPGTALGGGEGVFSTPSAKLDPDILET